MNFFQPGKVPKEIMINRFLVFGKQTYTRETAAIVFEIFRSITLQENTWTTRNKDTTQIYTDDEHLLALASLTIFSTDVVLNIVLINLSGIFIPCCPCIFLKSYGTKDLENNCRCLSSV